MSAFPMLTVQSLFDDGEAGIQTGPFGTQLAASEYVDEGIPVINVRNVGFGNIRDADLEYVNEAKAYELRKHRLLRGDIVFGRKGAVERHALIDERSEGWIQGSDCLRLRVNGDRVLPKFLSYYFTTKAHQDWMQALCSFGATMSSLNQDIVKRISFPCPALPLQRKIVGILSAYDELIENNRRRIANLGRMVEEIYREWFVRMRFPGYRTTKLVKAVPDGWEQKRLSDLTTSQYGFTASSSIDAIGPKFLRITDIVPGVIDWATVPYCAIDVSETDKYALQQGDVVVARTGATVGYAKLIHKRHPASVFASYLVRIKATDPLYSLFLGVSIERQSFKDFIQMFVTGAAQPQANATTMLKFPMLVPAKSVIEEFNRIIEPILDARELCLEQIETLKESKHLLLNRLISGRLAVSSLEVAFPGEITDSVSTAIGATRELAHA